MKEQELLLNRLNSYGKSDFYPFHMPGHKRRTDTEFLENFPNPYGIDITEIDGFDNLHHPEGILKESMKWAAEVYGADKTYYLVNGSSCGILSAISASVRPGGRILMSRNCHKSAYHGVILNQLKSSYIYPQILDGLGIQGGILPEDVERYLDEYPDTEAVLMVSPTYDGIVSDVAKIAEIVHKKRIPLIVDEAHGAHFSFGNDGEGRHPGREKMFPVSALDCGADIVIQSLHKTLPSFTQTAVIHVRRGYVDAERLEQYLQMYQSSSPSYVLMAGIERCIFEMEKNGGQNLREFVRRLEKMRRELAGMKHLKLLGGLEGRDDLKKAAVCDIDRSKIVISCRNCGYRNRDGSVRVLSGSELSDWMREKYCLELEMSGADYVVAITSFMDTSEGLERLERAFTEIDRQLCDVNVNEEDQQMPFYAELRPHAGMTLSQAVNASSDTVEISRSSGCTAAEFVYIYPPGIPILAPGEVITDQEVKKILHYKELRLPVQGMADSRAQNIRVVKKMQKEKI